ncbi:MAG: helix-turn-helix transcriptional regulator [Proteobacteria bacterium]|nr:helix-turn-helix transcriptional regulator [Pseudomonadota bacterium]
MQERQAAMGFSALGNETRLAIFRLLVRAGDAGTTTGQIGSTLAVPLSTLAHHLDSLAHAGLIKQRKLGRQVINSANYQVLTQLMDYLTENCCEDQSGASPGERGSAKSTSELTDA